MDGLRCENGSLCTENENSEGDFFCDCSTAKGDFAGLFCEYEALEYCRPSKDANAEWFCVQGSCNVKVRGGNSKYECKCPAEYEGPVR